MHMRLLGWALVTGKMDIHQSVQDKAVVYDVEMATWWEFNGQKKTWQDFIDAALIEFPQPKKRDLAEDIEFADRHTE